MIFSTLGHGSSQGLGIGGNFPPTESTCGIMHDCAFQTSFRTSIAAMLGDLSWRLVAQGIYKLTDFVPLALCFLG
jgi:hypothetical protein